MNKKNRIMFLDGAMGTSLAAKGADPTPISNIQNPELVKQILKDYIKAGSDIIETNTFSATSRKFKEYKKINRLGVQLAKAAIKDSGRKNVKIAGSIGATGFMVKPVGKLDFEDAVNGFKEQLKILYSEGVDLFIIETMDDISEMRAALIAAKETAPEIPVISTMTFADNERTSTGTPPEVAACVMDKLGAEVLGVNCSFGPDGLINVVKRMRRVTKKPIIVQANAGMPEIKKGKTVYHLDPAKYAGKVKKLVQAGASYIGGCCGTTPEHIKAVIRILKEIPPKQLPVRVPLIITSRTKWAEFGKFPLVIGERINFIAHKELKNSKEKIVSEGLKQKKAGADALDVNLGSDEEKTCSVVEILSKRVDLPIVLDSQNYLAVEKAVRQYPGVMLLNSISAEKKKMDELIPVVKKYGMPFIALCIDDKGVPKTLNGKISVYKAILSRLKEEKINEEDIVVDPLTLAVASNTSYAVETLKAISKIADNTVLGISNISSGLPQRALLNEVFSVLAVQAGCSALIVNPLDSDLMYGIYAAALLAGRDENAKEYLKYFTPEEAGVSFDHPLSQAILDGAIEKSAEEVKKALKEKNTIEIINKHIIPALDQVGIQYKMRRIFLPQLIESAKAAEKAMKIIEKKLKTEGKDIKKRGKILIATVKGDIHDIGKSLVALILKNHSFDVKDMGVDVDSGKIVTEAKRWNADIIALSSLMTTTMHEMQEIIIALDKKKLKIPVIIGGAAITGEYAKKIGAYYGRDAVEAVKISGKIVALKSNMKK